MLGWDVDSPKARVNRSGIPLDAADGLPCIAASLSTRLSRFSIRNGVRTLQRGSASARRFVDESFVMTSARKPMLSGCTRSGAGDS